MDSFRDNSKEVEIVMSVFFDMHEFARAIDALEANRLPPSSPDYRHDRFRRRAASVRGAQATHHAM